MAILDALESIVDGKLYILPFIHPTILELLIRAAVGDNTYIMFDWGIRGASDVFKALALGAKFVFVGRLWVWVLSIMGETGVRHVMKSVLADFDILLNVTGYRNVGEIDCKALGESID